ncbi:MAG: DUF3368 domain-containing protein, partial [Spirochaetales bacterium]|nr:DUF3368 domain-containing protein [Spirochaetales bacterium]
KCKKLTNSKQVSIIEKIFTDFFIPEQVYTEVTMENKPYSIVLAKQLHGHVKKITNTTAMQILTMDIDSGEAAAIILALENHIHMILVDDARARKVAIHNNLKPIGTLGILIKAKQLLLIKDVKSYMDILIEHNVHISSALYKDVLDIVNE